MNHAVPTTLAIVFVAALAACSGDAEGTETNGATASGVAGEWAEKCSTMCARVYGQCGVAQGTHADCKTRCESADGSSSAAQSAVSCLTTSACTALSACGAIPSGSSSSSSSSSSSGSSRPSKTCKDMSPGTDRSCRSDSDCCEGFHCADVTSVKPSGNVTRKECFFD